MTGGILVDGHEGTAVGLLGVLVFILVVPIQQVGELFQIKGLGWDTNGGLEFFIAQGLEIERKRERDVEDT